MFCSFADLLNPQFEFDGKACASVGQSSLMALYDTMFSQVPISYLIYIFLVIFRSKHLHMHYQVGK